MRHNLRYSTAVAEAPIIRIPLGFLGNRSQRLSSTRQQGNYVVTILWNRMQEEAVRITMDFWQGMMRLWKIQSFLCVRKWRTSRGGSQDLMNKHQKLATNPPSWRRKAAPKSQSKTPLCYQILMNSSSIDDNLGSIIEKELKYAGSNKGRN